MDDRTGESNSKPEYGAVRTAGRVAARAPDRRGAGPSWLPAATGQHAAYAPAYLAAGRTLSRLPLSIERLGDLWQELTELLPNLNVS